MNRSDPQDVAIPTPSPTGDDEEAFDVRATGRLSALNISRSETADQLDEHRRFNWRLAVGYLVVSILWIVFTDLGVEWFISGPEARATAQTVKGVIFVTLSAGFIFFLATRHFARIRRVERKIHDRDAHIGRIIDTMGNGVALLDLDGTIVDVNPTLAQLLGRSSSILVGQSVNPVRAVDDHREMNTDEILRSARRNGQWSGEVAFLRQDDVVVPVHMTLAPLFDEAQELTGYVAVYLDLREIKTARAHLHGLGAVIEQLATEPDLEVVGNTAISSAIELTDTHFGEVLLASECKGEQTQLTHRWRVGLPSPRPEPTPWTLLPEFLRTVLRDECSLTEADADLRFMDSGSTDDTHQGDLAVVPITIDDQRRGALVVGRTPSDGGIDAERLPLLEAVARQLGVAIHRHELLEDARRSEARFREVVNTVPDILYRASLPSFSTEFISPSVERILGAPAEQFLDNRTLWRELIHEDDLNALSSSPLDCIDAEEFGEQIQFRLDESDRYTVEYRIWNFDRTRFFWFEDRGRILRDAQGCPRGITGVVSNITARKHAEGRLEFLAFHDRLTGLPNRLGFLEKLDHWLAEVPELQGALLFCDLDRFHLVNDIYGHESGNSLLLEAARRIEDVLPPESLLSRIGADEFVSFVPTSVELSADELKDFAQEITLTVLAEFRRPFSLRENPSYLSTTIGIGLLTEKVEDGQDLLKHAHRALAHAKQMGPANFAFYAGKLAEHQQRRLSLQSQIHHGLEHQEFTLHYQPIVDLEDGSIIGGEALLRWTTSSGERISPGEFIPVAEDSGLILPLGDWVLRQACRDLRQWQQQGLDLTISINLSPLQFFQADIVESVLRAAQDEQISPSSIELELTESAMLVDPDETSQILSRLQEAGFAISIDDFGTGYSSLGRLKQLPVQKLKIDRSFVCDLPDAQRDLSIVRSVVTLSKNFNLLSLAEGIETEAQWQLLREMGCLLGQGYYFSRPLPAEQFHALCLCPPDWSQQGDRSSG